MVCFCSLLSSGVGGGVDPLMTEQKRKLLEQAPRLVERYIRLRMHTSAQRLTRLVMRRVLPFRERERKKALIGAVAAIAKQTSKSRRQGYRSSAVLFNLTLFFLIAERDIQAVKVDALTHPDSWKRSLCARVILLTIYELDLDKVAGSKLRQALEDAGVTEDGKRRITQALRSVRQAQQKAQNQFAFLRNSTIAHRDADAVLQLRSIVELDEREVVRIGTEFYEAARLFLSVMPEVLAEVGSMQGLLRQIGSQAKRNGVKNRRTSA